MPGTLSATTRASLVAPSSFTRAQSIAGKKPQSVPPTGFRKESVCIHKLCARLTLLPEKVLCRLERRANISKVGTFLLLQSGAAVRVTFAPPASLPTFPHSPPERRESARAPTRCGLDKKNCSCFAPVLLKSSLHCQRSMGRRKTTRLGDFAVSRPIHVSPPVPGAFRARVPFSD